jgi:hypothetical protein
MTARDAFARRAVRRWWLFLVLGALGAAVAAMLVQQPAHRVDSTTEFVVRPTNGLSARDVPTALDALQPTGSLMNTLLAVLGSSDFVADAARAAHVNLATASVEVSLRPGTVILDATSSTPNSASTRALSGQFATRASDYVRAKFAAYSLESFSTTDTTAKPTRSTAQAIGAGALLGILLAAALVAWSTGRALRRTTTPSQPTAAETADLTASRTKKAAAAGAGE